MPLRFAEIYGYNPFMPLTPEQSERYNRHLLLPEIGEAGQKKLLGSRVLVIGAGGLGSPVAFYLAAAGVGTIGLVDPDRVDLTNLQRQILHTTDSIGVDKVKSGAKRLTALNPDTKVHSHKVRFENTNAVSLLKDYDLAVGAVDSFETRFLINKTCVSLKKPNVYGAVFRYEGQTSVFYPEGPCYQCLFPESPSREALPHCAGGGLLGVLPGVIGLVMATETIKAILGLGVSLAGRLLTYDLLKMKFREIMIRKRSDCPVCGHEGIGARD